MTAADIDYLVAWQQGSGIKVSLALNGAGGGRACPVQLGGGTR